MIEVATLCLLILLIIMTAFIGFRLFDTSQRLTKELVDASNKLRQAREQNLMLRNEHEEYFISFGVLLEALENDTQFLRSSLTQRFMNVPEFQDLNRQIQDFEVRITAIKRTLRDQNLIQKYEE